MNVLVYSGPGTTTDSVKHCLESLRRHLSPHYAVISVTSAILTKEPWEAKTALLVFPGGADLPFCREFNGAGTMRIKKYVRQGGLFAGFCAGGYFGSARCEFEVGNLLMEVSGPRELGFFPGTCRGAAFKGFVYASESGARAAELVVNQAAFPEVVENCVNYYNGGGVFVDADKYDSVDILAEYAEELDVASSDGPAARACQAAVVLCKVGSGLALLTGSHPEFIPELMKGESSDGGVDLACLRESVCRLASISTRLGESNYSLFLNACLQKLGLKVNDSVTPIPRLTPLFLTSAKPAVLVKFLHGIREEVGMDDGIVLGTNDTFRFHYSESFTQIAKQDEYEDPDTAIKEVQVYKNALPGYKSTPFFNLEAYYSHLLHHWEKFGSVGDFGSTLMYGEVLTSTSTMLDKNFNLLKLFPDGFTITGTTQVSGRGRGGNVWVNPPGVLASSVVVRIPLSGAKTSPVVFIQYVSSLAMVEAVRNYAGDGPSTGYAEMPIRIKWPNDVYILKPEFVGKTVSLDSGDPYAKICGTMVNANVIGTDYTLVVGCGINVANAAPTTSLNIVLDALNSVRIARGELPLPPYGMERLLAGYMFQFETMYREFLRFGFRPFLDLYYQRWLHSGHVVNLEEHRARARITGISSDWGMLLAEEVDEEGRATGVRFELQPDGNSFDMFRGLISKKNR
ncbi:hypothetical protein BABINDRAFT_36147 [Babjeviella inositovora NRRL Y-12698]|uniref:BPL/LPL catalytic domain-containing protein n=1 Tax=Babjeviella inositovora NRRL Y-12698 TaxID=984486 RepID=A0A1E3QQ86_9ASCO|nr:uncharacterized protein BABINDRAFT_36147 [Babjeviella inositovora NRRL Y-12698]ODQ79863.1 hypothetical protein BABINDRAFT_36147 [Babjeviella inositovora NRRL Y-12698]